MTTILAAQGDSWAVIGFDSLVSDEGGRSMTLATGSAKVVKSGQYLIGAAGDVRAINILSHVFTPPKVGDLVGVRLDKFVTSKFVPALRTCFEEQGYAPKEAKERATYGSVIIMVVNGTVYEIDEDYSWARTASSVYAAGTGSDYALGAVYALLKSDTPNILGIEKTKKIVRECVSIAAKLDGSSGPPVHVLHQTSPTR